MNKTAICLVLFFLVSITTGCTVLGFAWGNIYDERKAQESVSSSDTLIADCRKGDVVFLTDHDGSSYLGKVLKLDAGTSVSLGIKDDSVFDTDYQTKAFDWADVRSIQIIEPHHYGMLAGTLLGTVADFLFVMLMLSINGIAAPQ